MESIALQRQEDACRKTGWCLSVDRRMLVGRQEGACRLIGGCLSETGRCLLVDRRLLVGDGQALVGR